MIREDVGRLGAMCVCCGAPQFVGALVGLQVRPQVSCHQLPGVGLVLLVLLLAINCSVGLGGVVSLHQACRRSPSGFAVGKKLIGSQNLPKLQLISC